MAYLAIAGYNTLTDTLDEVDFFSYHAATNEKGSIKKKEDPDYPTYEQAISRPDAEQWIEAIEKEVTTFIEMNTWTVVPKFMPTRAGKKVIPMTCAFRL